MKATPVILAVLAAWLVPGPAIASQDGPHDRLIRERFAEAGLPAELAVRISHAESSGRARVTGKGGERGLFQFDRATWERRSRRPWAEAFDPKANTEAAVRHWLALRSKNPSAGPRDFAAWHNAGRRSWKELGPEWTVHHPNRTYRSIYRRGE